MSFITDKVRQNVSLTFLLLLGAIAGAIVSIRAASDELDRMVVSEPELLEALKLHMGSPHPQAQKQIDANNLQIAENNRRGECWAIDIRISIVEQQIWQMEQAGGESPRLVEKRRELNNLEDRRKTLNCANL